MLGDGDGVQQHQEDLEAATAAAAAAAAAAEAAALEATAAAEAAASHNNKATAAAEAAASHKFRWPDRNPRRPAPSPPNTATRRDLERELDRAFDLKQKPSPKKPSPVKNKTADNQNIDGARGINLALVNQLELQDIANATNEQTSDKTGDNTDGARGINLALINRLEFQDTGNQNDETLVKERMLLPDQDGHKPSPPVTRSQSQMKSDEDDDHVA